MKQMLADAATAAGFAPSLQNTQPWKWVVRNRFGSLELHADRSRQLESSDPQGRLLTISCGAALHHARIALAAGGWGHEVDLLPDAAEPDLLAIIKLGPQTRPTPEAIRAFSRIRTRHTDRRPVGDEPPPHEAIEAMRAAGTAEGVNIHVLTEDQVGLLGSAAVRADRMEIVDPRQRTELAYWVGGDRPDGTGVPMEVIPSAVGRGVVPGRDFVRGGRLAPREGSDRAAVYLMLFGNGDEPGDWLRAGQALSATWLTAAERELSVLPFSSVIEVAATREAMRAILSGLGYPYLVLRVGVPDREHGEPPPAPRLPAAQTVSMAD